MPFVIGETVGQYQLVEQLGMGGMALVFKAYHPKLDRFVAIKVLHADFTGDSTFLARFQREARVVAQLDHPNIVPIYDYSEQEGRPYLVMKFIEGETLKARMERGLLPPSEIMQIVDKIGNALSYAHSHNVLHRDIKPSNVLISKEGQIYLADFGLARLVQSTGASLTSDRFVGTPQYISPEQAMSKSDLDARTDVYSFGVMLYEMLVGRVPFDGDSLFAIIHDHIYTPLPLPRQFNPQVSEAEELLLLKALAKNPEDRFKDIEAMVQAFHSAEEDHSPATPAPVEIQTPAEETRISDIQSDRPIPDLTSTSLAQPPVISPPPQVLDGEQSGRKIWIVGISITATLALLILCMAFVMPRLLRIKGNTAAQKTSTAFAFISTERLKPTFTQPVTDTPANLIVPTMGESTPGSVDINLVAAEKFLEASILDWKNGDINSAGKDLAAMEKSAGGDNLAFIMQAIKTLVDRQAWLLAGMVIFDDPGLRPILTTSKNLPASIHEILYRAAEDKLAGPFFTKYGKHPAFLVAGIRYDLLYGDRIKANNELAVILTNPAQLQQFPEARLLEIEFRLQQNDISGAQKLLQTLETQRQLPDWIQQMAAELALKLKSK